MIFSLFKLRSSSLSDQKSSSEVHGTKSTSESGQSNNSQSKLEKK